MGIGREISRGREASRGDRQRQGTGIGGSQRDVYKGREQVETDKT